MSAGNELAELFRRDIDRLLQEVKAFPNQADLWQRLPGISNSAGNLMLHLEGNLREYIGRQLGGVAYNRKRDLEFSSSGVPLDELLQRVTAVKQTIPDIVSGLSDAVLDATYPQEVLGAPVSTRKFLIHLQGHLNYHLGQINYLRRTLTEGRALSA
jgi:uncharacterized damage-inducible protein DinB